jgi:diaminopimelate epimerase
LQSAIRPLSAGEIIVRLPGITHLLLNTDCRPLPANPLIAAREKLLEHGLEKEEAAGIIWFSKHDDGTCSIIPVVHVASTESYVPESACGSGSLALALHMAPEKELSVSQPSGHALTIHFTAEKAWIRGVVTVTAHGRTHVSL